jgi:hypothetical protein
MRLPAAGLLEACDDPKLFGVDLWPLQRARLAAVERGPRMHVWADGRRSSKTTRMALVGLWCCLFRPELLEFLRPGERGYAVGIATNARQGRLMVKAALSVVERSPLLAELIESVSEDEILFANGTGFAAFPCSSRGGRGWPVFALLLDEFAHFLSETEGPQVADRVFEALVPSTAQFADLARIVIASTPWGTSNLFAELFQRASSGELEDAVAATASTAEANPTIDATFLERERARDREGFAQEYEANFAAGGAAFLDPERVADATAERAELPAEMGTGWVAGLDPAFSSDPFGLAIVGRDRRTSDGRLVLGLARRWMPSPHKARTLDEARAIEDAVLDEAAAVCLGYGARVVTDQFKSRGVADYLRRKGLSVRTEPMTAASKTAAFSALRARLYLDGLELYEEAQLLAELRRLRSKYAAGQASVVNPRSGGSHGDIAQALAIAIYEHDRHGIAIPGDGERGPQLPREDALPAGLRSVYREAARSGRLKRGMSL